jgi:hypothetical protein
MPKLLASKAFKDATRQLAKATARLHPIEQLTLVAGIYYAIRRTIVEDVGEELVLKLEEGFADTTRRVNAQLGDDDADDDP